MTFAFPMFLPRPAGSAPPATFEAAVIALLGAKLRAFWLYDEPSHLWQDTSGTTAVTSDTDPVGRVDDLSGNGKHLLQATGGNRPAYRTGPARTVYDGANDYLSIATAAFPIDEFELFQVLAETGTSHASSRFVCFAPNTGNDYARADAFMIGPGNATTQWVEVYCNNGALQLSHTGASGPLPLSLVEVNKGTSVATLHVNGSLSATDSSFTAFTSPHSGDFLDGASYIGGGISFYASIARRVTIMTAALTTGERNDLRDLINARYSLW